MPSNFGTPKKRIDKVYPVHATKTVGELEDFEPILTHKLLKSRFLKRIDLKEYSDSELKDEIKVAISEAELELGVWIINRTATDRLMFDRNLYKKFVHTQVKKGPVRQVNEFAIYSANEEKLFEIPPQWVDMGQAHRRQLNVIPYLASYSANITTGIVSNAGIAFLATLETVQSVPSYWQIEYVAGMQCEGNVPVVINQLIGIIAALNILSNKGPESKYTSTSLSQDGIGQSTGGPGPALYQQRIAELEAKKERLIGKLKNIFASKFIMTNI